MPVAVEQEKGAPHGMGTFLLHQGIQRRVSITIVHESGPELIWRDVKELVVGRIRKTPEWCELDGENTVLSLSLYVSNRACVLVLASVFFSLTLMYAVPR